MGEMGVSPNYSEIARFRLELGDAAPAANSIRGAIYHLMSRGDRREEIFRDDLDREDFLKTLGAASQKTGWQATPTV
jgi:hypothetical protein